MSLFLYETTSKGGAYYCGPIKLSGGIDWLQANALRTRSQSASDSVEDARRTRCRDWVNDHSVGVEESGDRVR